MKLKQKHGKSGKKRYLEGVGFDYIYKEIDVARDVVDFSFVMKSDEDPNDVKYFLSITDWTETQLKLFINFTEPLSISKG